MTADPFALMHEIRQASMRCEDQRVVVNTWAMKLLSAPVGEPERERARSRWERELATLRELRDAFEAQLLKLAELADTRSRE